MRKRQIIIDCDPGLDDAVALLLAFAATDRINVLGITTVAGNVRGELTHRNARIVRDLAGNHPDLPVRAGAPRPLVRDPVTAEDFHGTTGLGGLDLPKPKGRASRQHGVNFLIQTLHTMKGFPATLVVTGPMTNVALALSMAPDIAEGLSEIVIMGGADTEGGNITPHAEFNIFADPHAAQAVFRSGIPMRVLSLDVTHQLLTQDEMVERVRALGSRQAVVAADLLAATGWKNRQRRETRRCMTRPPFLRCCGRTSSRDARRACPSSPKKASASARPCRNTVKTGVSNGTLASMPMVPSQNC